MIKRHLNAQAVILSLCIGWASPCAGQQLQQQGILAIGVFARTRTGDEDFQLGDLMYVSAFQPSNSGGMYVSVHMEYSDPQHQWSPVPTADTPLGSAYHSPKYAGLRDFVKFEAAAADTTRHICLFLRYAAAALPTGNVYERRYVIRVWDGANKEIPNSVLPAEQVSVNPNNRGQLEMTLVHVQVKACWAAQMTGEMTPMPESVDNGLVRFFNPMSGQFVCPGQ